MSLADVQKYFEGTELEGKVLVFEHSSATVELAAQAVGTQPNRIAKTLSFLIDEQPILIVVSGESRVDNKKYKQQFQKKAKMIPYNEVEQMIGHAPGGVCPFAARKEVPVYLDISLRKYETVFPAAGSSNSAIETTMSQLEQYSGYREWVDVCK